MKIEIDQSGKIEQTNKLTVIAYSNGMSKSISITSTEKKILQKHFRVIGKGKLFVLVTFCILIYCLIKNIISDELNIYIDREYAGFDDFIRQRLIEFSGNKLKRNQIHISEIGKKSRVHIKAHADAVKRKGDIVIKSGNCVKFVKNKRSGSA